MGKLWVKVEGVWTEIATVPSGGAVGQVLGKTGAGDYQSGWVDPATGGGGATDVDDIEFLAMWGAFH